MGSAEECQAAEEFSRTCQLLQEVCREFLQDSKADDRVVVQGQEVHLVTGLSAAFEELKRRLTTALILTPPDESQPFQVFCDASLNGLGGVLMQGRNIVAYTSRQLK